MFKKKCPKCCFPMRKKDIKKSDEIYYINYVYYMEALKIKQKEKFIVKFD